MKKLIIILCCLIVALNSFSQDIKSNNSFIFQPTTNPVTTFRIKGIFSSDSAIYLPIRENNWTPTRSGAIQFAPTQSAPYYYNMDSAKWLPFGSGGGSGGSLASLYFDTSYFIIGVNPYNPNATDQTVTINPNGIATITYVNNFFADTAFIFPFNAQERTDTPRVSPADSTWWLIGDTPTGIWITHENQLAQRIGTGYVYYDEPTSTIVNVITPSEQWQKVGDIWELKTTFVVNNGNLIRLPLRIGTQDDYGIEWMTHDTTRFGVNNLGDLNYYRWDADTSTAYTLGVVYKNQKFDTVHLRNLYAVSPLSLSNDTLYCVGCSGFANAIDSLRNNSGVLEARKGGVFIPQFTLPTSGGSTNSNIGSGFRWAVPNTNNIKTVFNGYAIGIDSSSNTNALTLKADTSLLLTKLGAAAIYLTANQAITVTATGDATGTSTSSGTAPSLPLTLATVNSNVGSFGDATHVGAFTVNAKGLITAASSVAITGFASSTLADSHLFVGNASNVATDVAASGDLTLANTGAFTIANLAVTNAKIANSTIDLTAKVTGVLPIANGGTNNGSLSVTAGTIYYGDGTKLLGLAPGTAKQHLTGGTTPVWKDTATGGGSGITKAYPSLVVSSGGDSISQRFNVLTYNPNANDGVTDAVPAIRAAIAAAFAAHGGIVFLPYGAYSLQSIDGTCNCYFKIPQSSDSTRMNIVIEGEGMPSFIPVGGGLPGSTTQIAKTGTRLISTATSFAAGAAIIGTGGGGVTCLTVRNLGMQVKNNPAGTGPVMGGINFSNGYNEVVENVVAYIDTLGEKSTLPTNDVSGFETPNGAFGDNYIFYNCYSIGFKNGFKAGEHAKFISCDAWCNYYGINWKTGSEHASQLLDFTFAWNAIDMYFVGATRILPSTFDEEYEFAGHSGGKWYDRIFTVKDSANLGAGMFTYKSTPAGGGVGTATVSGGTGLYFYRNDSTNYPVLNRSTNIFNSGGNTKIGIDGGTGSANFGFYQSGTQLWTIATQAYGGSDKSLSDYNIKLNRAVIWRDSLGNVNIAGGAPNVASTSAIAAYVGGNVYMPNNVGIGVASPSIPLDVNGTSASLVHFKNTSTHTQFQIDAISTKNSNLQFQNAGANKWYLQNVQSSGTADRMAWTNSDANSNTEVMTLLQTGKLGIGIQPTAILHLKAGTASANTAPLKLTSGTNLTTAEAGAMEYTTPQLFFTNGDAIRQEIPQIQQSRVSTQFDKTSSTALANITGLTASLAAGKTYRFEAILYTTSNVAGGVQFAIAGTVTATSIIYEDLVNDANINAAQTRATALATAVGGVTAVTNAYSKITGTITVNAAGTCTVQFAQNASNGTASSVLVGSTFVVTQIN